MMKISLFCILIVLTQIAWGAPHPCQFSVERQEPLLSRDSFTQLENDKSQLINGLVESSELPAPVLSQLIRLIESDNHVVFRFASSKGVWISIVNVGACKVLKTEKVHAF